MSVRVELGERSYEVLVGAGLLKDLGELVQTAVPLAHRVLLVTDDHVPQGRGTAYESLAGSDLTAYMTVDSRGEGAKSYEATANLLEPMALWGFERGDVVVSVGGGALCDLAGFAASVYCRGIAVVHCPTTLLSMVDASVGGKTGVNIHCGDRLHKNAIGTFWQPRLVVADVETLRTLPQREFCAGIAECLKHGLIAGDTALWDWTLGTLDRILARDESVMVELIERHVALKARFVAGDEREERDVNGRALLNLGHTFGHVIEGLGGAGGVPPLLHGECVGLGLIAAAAASEALGMARGAVDVVRDAVARVGLPVTVTGLPDDAQLIELMRRDKKVQGGELTIVALLGIGMAEVVRGVDEGAVAAGWSAVRG